ncbi:MAG: hypothetical protein ACLQBB_14060 [Solirubrobacteraceae bacterium]
MRRPRTILAFAFATALALVGSGCANPDGPATGAVRETPGSPGEPAAPPSPPPAGQHPLAPAATPASAVERFALLYTDWDSNTLAEHQALLAAISVGTARLDARKAAASARAHALARERVRNEGQIVALAPDRARRGWWVVVTRERTGGGEYEGLPPTLHVTLANTVPVPSGWAVSAWQPQT